MWGDQPGEGEEQPAQQEDRGAGVGAAGEGDGEGWGYPGSQPGQRQLEHPGTELCTIAAGLDSRISAMWGKTLGMLLCGTHPKPHTMGTQSGFTGLMAWGLLELMFLYCHSWSSLYGASCPKQSMGKAQSESLQTYRS